MNYHIIKFPAVALVTAAIGTSTYAADARNGVTSKIFELMVSGTMECRSPRGDYTGTMTEDGKWRTSTGFKGTWRMIDETHWERTFNGRMEQQKISLNEDGDLVFETKGRGETTCTPSQ